MKLREGRAKGGLRDQDKPADCPEDSSLEWEMDGQIYLDCYAQSQMLLLQQLQGGLLGCLPALPDRAHPAHLHALAKHVTKDGPIKYLPAQPGSSEPLEGPLLSCIKMVQKT